MKTGEFCFQFDNDEPFASSDINDFGELTIILRQEKSKTTTLISKDGTKYIDEEVEKDSSIIFDNGSGKTFRIFIKDTTS